MSKGTSVKICAENAEQVVSTLFRNRKVNRESCTPKPKTQTKAQEIYRDRFICGGRRVFISCAALRRGRSSCCGARSPRLHNIQIKFDRKAKSEDDASRERYTRC